MNRLYTMRIPSGDRYSVLPFLLPFLAIPALTPFFQQGFSATVDGMLHLLRLVLFHEHVGCTLATLRWTPELYLGYGYPLFNFYAPGSYYLTNFVHCLGLALPQAILVVLSAVVLVAGYGAYWLADALLQDAERPARSWGALLAAVAYMYSPYFLMNIHARTAIPESLAEALLPWVLYCTWQLFYAPNPNRWILPAALTLGALAIAHNITLLLGAPFLLCYVVFLLWQRHERWLAAPRLLLPLAIAGLAAVGISAFFWLPMIGEKQYLSNFTLRVARYYMESGGWSWQTFLDDHWPFYYRIALTNPLGIAQLGLGTLGLLPLLRRAPIWRFWSVLTFLCCLAIGKFTFPLWQSQPLLLVPQFPWRLLILASLPLALFVAGFSFYFRQSRLRALVSVVILTLCIWGNFPRVSLDWNNIGRLNIDPDNIDVAAANFFEYDTNALGTGSAREFLPSGAGDTLFFPVPTEEAETNQKTVQIAIHSVASYHVTLQVQSTHVQPLHLTSFYFPGWRAQIDGKPVPLYADPNKGLLTVDLPTGESRLEIYWEATRLERIGSWLSQFTLVVLAIYALGASGLPKVQRLLGAGLLLLGFAIWFTPSAQRAPIQPSQPSLESSPAGSGIELLGFTSAISKNKNLNLFPYWFVQQPGRRIRMHWQILTQKRDLVAEFAAEPYFNTLHSDSWLAHTFVDDAYQVGLPYSVTAGKYRLQLQMELLNEDGSVQALLPVQQVGEIDLPTIALAEPKPIQPLHLEFGSKVTTTEVALTGWQLSVNQQLQTSPGQQVVVQPGDQLDYELYWQSLGTVSANYHSYFHLLDPFQQPIIKRDQLPGTFLYPPLAWNPQRVQPDQVSLTLPKNLPAGIYKPLIGLYRFSDGYLFNAYDQTGLNQENVFLPSIKVANFSPPSPGNQVSAQVGQFAQVTGFDLSSGAQLKAGEPLTITLYYHVLQPETTEYVRFIHLYSESLGMIAQFDSVPQNGANPTSSWVAGEWIDDSVTLQIPVDGLPGAYDLFVGFYDTRTQTRTELFDQAGAAVEDSQLRLTTVQVK